MRRKKGQLMRSCKRKSRRAAWLTCLCLTGIPALNGCVPTTMIADQDATSAMRNGKEIKDWPVFVPSPDKKSWTPVKTTIPKGAWIFMNYKQEDQ